MSTPTLSRINNIIGYVRRNVSNNPDIYQIHNLRSTLANGKRNLERISSTLSQSEYDNVNIRIEQLLEALDRRTNAVQTHVTRTPRIQRIYNQQRGHPKCAINRNNLESLLAMGFTVKKIATEGLLGGIMHPNTIHNYIKKHQMKSPRERYTNLTNAELEEKIRRINNEFPNSGANEVQAHLQNQGITVQRNKIRNTLATIDPIGTASRWSRTIERRTYYVPTPNYLWHTDSHHKLIRWNFVIHGSIDGYSRFIPMLRVSINNLAKTALDFFFESIKSCGIPGRVRGDGGSEFNHVEAFMELANGESRGSFLRGKSVHNQRIERLWRDVHEKVVEKYQKTFYHMENHGILDIEDSVHMFCLQHTFAKRINSDLQKWKDAHNNHKVRTEHNQTPLQMWMSGGILSQSSQCTAMSNMYRRSLQETETLVTTFLRSHNLEEPNNIRAVLQRFPSPLTIGKLHLLEQSIDVLAESNQYGIDIYNVMAFVRNNRL